MNYILYAIKGLWIFFNKYQIIFGVVFGWIATRLGVVLCRPNLTVDAGHEAFWPNDSVAKVKFLHVIVANRKRGKLSSFLFGTKTLNNTRAWVNFHDYESGAEIFRMDGRWASKREPMDSTGKVDVGEALVPPRETIPVGEDASISIALKDTKDSFCYGFNNKSYLFQWRYLDFKLVEKRYIVKIKVSAEGEEWTKKFVLLNLDDSLKNFRLLPFT